MTTTHCKGPFTISQAVHLFQDLFTDKYWVDRAAAMLRSVTENGPEVTTVSDMEIPSDWPKNSVHIRFTRDYDQQRFCMFLKNQRWSVQEMYQEHKF